MQQPTEQDMGRDLAADLRNLGGPHYAHTAEQKDARSKAAHEAAILRAMWAEAFKAYVHEWLDAAGVPHDPNPEHTADYGCRIAGRLGWLMVRAETAEAKITEQATLIEALKAECGDYLQFIAAEQVYYLAVSQRAQELEAEVARLKGTPCVHDAATAYLDGR